MEGFLETPRTGALRVTLIPPASIDGTRGGMRLVANTARGLAGLGHLVDVMVPRESPFLAEHPQIRISPTEAARARTLFAPVMRHLRRVRPQVIMTYGIETMLAAAMAKIFCRSGVRILPMFPDAPGVWITSPKDRLVLLFARSTLKKIRMAVAGSYEAQRDAADLLGITLDRVAVVKNPVFDAGKFERQTKEPADHQWFAAHSAPVILGVGQLIERKGFSTLLQAFSLLRTKQAARLMILGDGPQRQRLLEQAADSGFADDVCLRGFVENPYPCYRGAKVFANPSLLEGFPNTLVEALAAGTPVVTTDGRCGHGELLQGRRGGRMVAKGDVRQMADALADVLSCEQDGEELKTLVQGYETGQAARGHEEILRRMIGSG